MRQGDFFWLSCQGDGVENTGRSLRDAVVGFTRNRCVVSL
jgi:hypothetical protein